MVTYTFPAPEAEIDKMIEVGKWRAKKERLGVRIVPAPGGFVLLRDTCRASNLRNEQAGSLRAHQREKS